jgi:PAS domain S-box-containing protein
MRWMQQIGVCLRDAPGVLVRWAASVSDVTARRCAEDELRVSEERFALAVVGAKDGIWDRDLTTDMLYLSPRAQEISMGRPLDGVDVRHESEWRQWHHIHPDDAARREAAIRDHLKGRTPRWEGEWRVRHQDGSYHWVHARGICTRDASGRAVRFAGSVTDIDARKLTEQELKCSEERYALVMAAADEGYWDWIVATDDFYGSPRLLEMYGFPPGTIFAGRDDFLARIPLHPEDRPKWQKAVAAHFAGKTARLEMETRMLWGGETRWIHITGLVTRDAFGAVLRWTGATRDVTARRLAEEERRLSEEELKRLEQQLRQGQRLEALGNMAGGIAHDFNNILGAILGYGEMALRDAPKGSRLHRDLDNIMIAGERGRALVDRILAFSRSGAGERVAVHVEAVVREALELLSAKLPDNVRFETDLRAARAATLGDPTQVHQVFMNLATNAVQAMASVGVLRVSLETVRLDAPRLATTGEVPPGEFLVLKVIDTGVGIAPEILEQIFDPFFTTKQAGVGTGLGLSLVYGIVAELGGAIDVASTVGKGSAFIVYLPRAGDATEERSSEQPQVPRGDGQRVLVVDDEELLLTLAIRTLEELGYAPVGFALSAAALEAFRAEPGLFDAIVTDERMPGLSGSELIREVRAIRRAIPILLVGGYFGGQVTALALEAGADEVLNKPLSARDLAMSLARVLRSRCGIPDAPAAAHSPS